MIICVVLITPTLLYSCQIALTMELCHALPQYTNVAFQFTHQSFYKISTRPMQYSVLGRMNTWIASTSRSSYSALMLASISNISDLRRNPFNSLSFDIDDTQLKSNLFGGCELMVDKLQGTLVYRACNHLEDNNSCKIFINLC